MFYRSPREFSRTCVTERGVLSIFMYLLLLGSKSSVIILKYMSIQSVISFDLIILSWLFLACESLKSSEINVLWMWHSFRDSCLLSWTPKVDDGNSSKGKVVSALMWLCAVSALTTLSIRSSFYSKYFLPSWNVAIVLRRLYEKLLIYLSCDLSKLSRTLNSESSMHPSTSPSVKFSSIVYLMFCECYSRHVKAYSVAQIFIVSPEETRNY